MKVEQICKKRKENSPVINSFCEIRDTAESEITFIDKFPEAIDISIDIGEAVDNIEEETKKIRKFLPD